MTHDNTRHTPGSVTDRITEYLSSGGLFNPELMDHSAVRDLLIDAREAIPRQHPDLVGHIADAVRDACSIVLGKVVSFDDSRGIAATILDRINIANAQVDPPIESPRTAHAQGMIEAARICGSLAETTYDDAEGFVAATGCEAAIMKAASAALAKVKGGTDAR